MGRRSGIRAIAIICVMGLLLGALFIAATGTVRAETTDFTYSVDASGKANITGYNGSGGDVQIPTEIDGHYVGAIGDNAFNGNTNISSITFESTSEITSLGNYSFSNCSILTSITIPDSVTTIGNDAFKGSSALVHMLFNGSAPTTGTGWIDDHNTSLIIYYYYGENGFTIPTWQGIQTICNCNLVMGTNVGTTSPAQGISSVNGTVTITATAPAAPMGGRYYFDGWAGTGSGSYSGTANLATITMNESINETANWTLQYPLTMVTNNGTTSPAEGTSWYNVGTIVNLGATVGTQPNASERYVWGSWSGSGSGNYTGSTASGTVTMNGPITETASWTHQYQVSFAVSPLEGGAVSPLGTDQWEDAGSISIQATPSANYGFSSWTSDTSSITFDGQTASTQAIIAGAGTITVNFVIPPVGVTITSSPAGDGYVLVDGTAITTPHTFTWAIGDRHLIEAVSTVTVAGNQYKFSSWSDAGVQSHYYTVTDTTATVTASFTYQCQLTMAANYGTTNPSIGVSYFDPGTNVLITATAPSAPAGQAYVFVGWTGLGTGSYSGATNNVIVTLNVPISETATWALQSLPSAPTGVTVVPGDAQVYLNWTVPSSNGGPTIDYYVVYQDGVLARSVVSTAATINGLTNGHSYSFTVAAHNSAGNGPISTPVTVVPNKVIDMLVLNIVSPSAGAYNTTGNVTLKWTVTDVSSSVIKTEVSKDGSTWSIVTGTSRPFTGLTEGSQTLYVRVTDAAGFVNKTSVTFIVDTTSPKILYKSPTGSSVLTMRAINVTFSEAMNRTTTITIAGINGTTVWSGNNLAFIPSAALKGRTTYNVTVSGHDIAGNALSTSWTFTTANVGELSGIVYGHDGKVLANTLVTLVGPNTGAQTELTHVSLAVSTETAESQVTTTDANGKYSFYDVAIGGYTLEVTENGYATQSTAFTMTSTDVDNGGLVMDQHVSVGSMTDNTVMIGAIVVLVAAVTVLVFVLRRRSIPPAVVEQEKDRPRSETPTQEIVELKSIEKNVDIPAKKTVDGKKHEPSTRKKPQESKKGNKVDTPAKKQQGRKKGKRAEVQKKGRQANKKDK